MSDKTVLYGFGNWVDIHYMWIKDHFNIVGVYDQNPAKKERAEEIGWRFLSKDELTEQSYDNILLGSVREEEIKKFLIEDLKIEKEILSGNQLYIEDRKYKEENIIFNIYGDHPEYTFLIINEGEASLSIGLMNYFHSAVFEINKAMEYNWIPVVDMKNYYTCYHESIRQVGNVNPWEYFFKQPNTLFSLEEALNAQNIVYVTEKSRDWDVISTRENAVYVDKDFRHRLHEIYLENIKLSEKAQSEYLYFRNLLFGKKQHGKTLAVFIRGTDYTEGKAYMHPIQPTLEQVAEKVKYAISEWGGVKYIYVNAEESKSIEYMKKVFPDMIFSMERKLYDNFDADRKDVTPQLKFQRENDAFKRGMEYLISVLLATNCDYFIGGKNSGTMAALIMAGEFEHEYIFDLGRYGIDDDAYTYTPDGKPVYVNKRPRS